MRFIARPIVLLALGACASGATPSPPPRAAVTETTSASVPVETAADTAPATAVAITPTPDRHAEAVADADAVFAAMKGDLVGCYEARVKRDPGAHAFLTVDVVVNPDGTVRSVTTTGGARLGKEGLACVRRRIERAMFLPVWNGGTRHVSQMLEFGRMAPNDDGF